jgi:hypothetical protein
MRRQPLISLIAALAAGALVAGCGEDDLNPPTQPAAPIDAPTAGALGPAHQGAVYRPGRGPASFMGRWSEDVAWCALQPGGRDTPVEITVDAVTGGGAHCAIASIHQAGDSYDVELRCPSAQTVRFTVVGTVMTALYLAPDVREVTLNKCTTLADSPVEDAG